MQINSPVPEFTLKDTNGILHSLSACLGRIVIVNFWSAECPWSETADKQLLPLLLHHPDQLALLPIASNLNETHAQITQAAAERHLPFVLIDENCILADRMGAQNTPHAFVIDAAGVLRYQGAIDDTTFRKRIPERFHLQEAVNALLSGAIPEVQETPPYGCTIVRSL